MEAALASGALDLIGIARPFCTHPDCARELLRHRIEQLPAFEQKLHLAPRGWRSPASPILLMKMINVLGAQGWYYQQMDRIAHGRPVDVERGMLRSFLRYWWDDLGRALRLRR
jgi:hypothetical protein